MKTLTIDEISSAVLTATQEVFSTMLNLPAEPGMASEHAVEPPTFNGVVALVAIAGDWVGSGRLSCSSQLACRIAAALLMSEPYDSINEEVLDGIAEVANMIVGNVKTTLEATLGNLALGIPTVVFGHNYSTRSAGVSWIAIPFECGGETLRVHFGLIPKSDQHHLRPEHANLSAR